LLHCFFQFCSTIDFFPFGIFAQNGWTALIHAVKSGHADCVRLLLETGADKKAKDRVRVIRAAVSAMERVFLIRFGGVESLGVVL
jgi:hypothetical protein